LPLYLAKRYLKIDRNNDNNEEDDDEEGDGDNDDDDEDEDEDEEGHQEATKGGSSKGSGSHKTRR